MNPMSWFEWVRNQLVFLVLNDLQASTEVSILPVAACNPSWFTVLPVSYESNLNCLTVSILHDAAQRIGCKRPDARLKTKSVDAILRHFEGLRTVLASSSLGELTRRFSMHLPITSLRTRTALIAAAVDDAYGANVAAALCRPPVSLATSNSEICIFRNTRPSRVLASPLERPARRDGIITKSGLHIV
ncbi:hypothetical protein BDR06DRAFT_1024031 [Suillus hirtellus]|nr:hypothetical protein BDR06DRAFT_1024031 [Suillus hirtellus]